MNNYKDEEKSALYLFFHSKNIAKYQYFRSLTIDFLSINDYLDTSGICSNFFKIMKTDCHQLKKVFLINIEIR
jgi:hypothetical protein